MHKTLGLFFRDLYPILPATKKTTFCEILGLLCMCCSFEIYPEIINDV